MLSVSTVITSIIISTHSAKWDYDEPGMNTSHWEEVAAECGYSRQSPIDVPVDLTSTCVQPLELDWTSEKSHYAIRNNGHSLQAIPFIIDHNGGSDLSGLEVLHHTNDTNIRLTNKFYNTYESPVHKEYCFDSLHFHWGRTNEEGSEHLINGKSYPLEVHLVHYSCDYKVASAAINDYASGEAEVKYDDENVLAVIGVMFEIGEPNTVLGKMLDDIIIDGIFENKASEHSNYLEFYYAEFDVKGLLPESREMVAYLGSLTTPPCYETVRWHLMKQVMTVSEEQMDAFRALLESSELNDSMAPNFRPVTPKNGRKIYQCQEDVDDDMIDMKDDLNDNVNVVVEENNHDEIWKNVAIAFLALFGFTFLLCAAVLCYLCRTYEKINIIKRSPRMEAITEEQMH